MDRTCTLCREVKPLSEFYKDPTKSKGHDYRCKPCAKAKHKLYQQSTQGKLAYRRCKIKATYGVKLEDIPDKCESCGTSDSQICVDHDHKTGRVRGFLCSACNKALGFLKEDPNRMLGLIRYIQEK